MCARAHERERERERERGREREREGGGGGWGSRQGTEGGKKSNTHTDIQAAIWSEISNDRIPLLNKKIERQKKKFRDMERLVGEILKQ